MEIRKEQSIIKIYDGEKLCGGWNILTNTYIGCKGQQLKAPSTPFRRELNELAANNDLAHAVQTTIRGIFNLYGDDWETVSHHVEALISVGLYPVNEYYTWRSLRNKKQPALKKGLVEFLKENCHCAYSPENVKKYNFYIKYNKMFEQFNMEEQTWAFEVYDMSINQYNLPDDWTLGMILRALHEKVYAEKNAYAFTSILTDWYNKISIMEDKLEVKHNILTNYAILQWIYKEYRTKNYDEKLSHFNNCPWLYFEDETLVAYPLTTRTQFHAEAEYQHNCVENMYMERVFCGETHVVVIRKKNDLNTPYITCEVNNRHEIIQYLTRFNEHPRDPYANAFYHKYNSHLSLSK